MCGTPRAARLEYRAAARLRRQHHLVRPRCAHHLDRPEARWYERASPTRLQFYLQDEQACQSRSCEAASCESSPTFSRFLPPDTSLTFGTTNPTRPGLRRSPSTRPTLPCQCESARHSERRYWESL